MSELTWDQAVDLINVIPPQVMQVMRNEAVADLEEFIGDSGADIGSSDISGQVVPRIMRGDFSDDASNNGIISLFVGMAAKQLGIDLPYELPNKAVR